VTARIQPDRRLALAAGLAVASAAYFRGTWMRHARGLMAMDDGPSPPSVFPEPDLKGRVTLQRALHRRRSIREFEGSPISLAELGQLAWAAQGVTDPAGYRTAPSAGALYPLELYLLTGASEELGAGTYHYLPSRHGLERLAKGDLRSRFAAAALAQEWTARAAVIIVVAAAYARTTRKYGERGRRYVAIEAGHCVQNVYLQATAQGLGATEVGAFRDAAVSRLIGLPGDQQPVTSIVVGRPMSGRPT